MLPRLLLALLLTAAAAPALDLYVATDGNDAWSGSLPTPNAALQDGPFASLTRARDRAREFKTGAVAAEAVTVHVRAGVYALPATFQLNEKDSGSPSGPTVYRGYQNERPLLTGGLAVSSFSPYQGKILRADLSASGLKGKPVRQLLFEGKRQPLARYPNYDPANPIGGGWAYADGEMGQMYADIDGEAKNSLLVKPADWRHWAHPEEVEVFIFPRFNWWNDILRVKSVDAEKHTVTTASNASYGMRANDRFYFQNALEELDSPGEWYFDQREAVLYFWPPGAIEGKRVLLPRLSGIVEISKAAYVTLQGLDFECCDGTAVTLKDCAHCRLAACTLRDVGGFGGNGVAIVKGSDNGVVGCDLSGTGRNGVTLSGGDVPTLTSAGNFVDNCYLHHVGVYYKQGAGVFIEGVGQRVSHCLIHDAPRFGIMFSGNNHILEYNHLRHLALETEDVGATYCGGRDWLGSRGTVIRYNYIHDILGFGWNGQWTSPYFAWGVYLDDNTGGVDVIGNIVARCGRSLIHGHSARDCRVENNIFIEGGLRQWEFNGWLTTHHFWTSHFPTMVKGYESVASLPAWQNMRGMKLPPKDAPDSEGRVMCGNEFHRNIIAWKNPESRALNVVNFDASRNDFDRNLYWHYGQALLTGQHQSGPVISANLAPNPGLQGELGQLPRDWNWQIKPKPDAKAALTEDGLRIDAALNPEKKRDNYPIIASREIELTPGTSYHLRARLRTDHPGGKASVLLQCFIPARAGKPAHFWGSSPSNAAPTAEWKDYDFNFTIPREGEKGWHPEMKKFRIRFDWAEPEGALFAKDVLLEQVESLDEWASWQALGGDRHSLIADPQFVAPEKDDYRLQPGSPAFQLGFQPIPVEKIGPYADPLRATWPIVEAEGAREHPANGAP